MSHLLEGSSLMQSIDLSKPDFSTITDMSYMFNGCTALTSVVFGANATTSNVTTFKNMFKDCTSITTINLNKFNTNKCSNYSGMFQNCSALTTLNVASFTPSLLTTRNLDNMFNGCINLEELDAGYLTRWLRVVTDCTSNNMFLDCVKLRNYDPDKVDVMMADSLSEGYFKYYPIEVFYKQTDANNVSYSNH